MSLYLRGPYCILAGLTQGLWAHRLPTPYPSSSSCEQKLSSPCLTIVGPSTQSSHHILPAPRAYGPTMARALSPTDPSLSLPSLLLQYPEPSAAPRTRIFFKTHFCPCLPDENMGQRGVEGTSLDPGQRRPSSHTGFLNIESSNREHLNPRKKEDTEVHRGPTLG